MLGAKEILQGLIQYLVLLFSLSVHESSHAWTADRFGDPTARYLGRITLNPIAHMDLFGTVIFPLLMIFSSVPLIGWARPVPVNLGNLGSPRRDHLWIAAAGPLSNLALCAGFLVLLAALLRTSSAAREALSGYLGGPAGGSAAPSAWEPILLFLLFGVFLNAMLAVFNLLPVPPLDGNAVFQGVLPAAAADRLEGFSRYGFLILFLLVFSGVLRYLLDPVYALLAAAVFLLAS